MKLITRNTRLISFTTTVSTSILGFLGILILSRMFNPSQLGEWMIYITAWTLADMLRSGLVQNALIRYYSAQNNNVYTGAAWVLGIGFTVFAIIGLFIIGFFTPLSNTIVGQLSWLLMASLPYSVALWQQQAEQRFDRLLLLRLGFSVSFFGMLLVAAWLKQSSENLAIIQTLVYGFLSALAMLLNWTNIGSIRTCKRLHLFELWKFGRYSVMTLLGTNLLKSSDTFLLGAFLNPSVVAFYNLPYKLIEIVEIPIRSMVMTILPKWASKSHQSKSILKLVSQEVLQMMIFVLPIAVACFLFAEDFMVLMGGETYRSSASLLRIFAVYSLFLPFDRLIGVALDAHGKPKLNTIKVAIMAIINIIGDAVVLQYTTQIWPVALVTVLTVVMGVVFGLYQLWQLDQNQIVSNHSEVIPTIESYPLVSIITINYNQAQVTADLLRSLQKITYPNVEILVIDNNSTQRSVLDIQHHFPEVCFIKSAHNLGFAGGNNLAVAQAKGDYLLFINNDVEVAPDFLEPLVAQMQANTKIGMVSPKIRYFDTPEVLQYAGSSAINSITGQGHFIGHGQVDNGQFDKNRQTAFVHGAAMLVSKAVIAKTGLMDDSFFLYYEELDWCARSQKDGFESWYVANSVVWHKESISTGKQSALKVYYQTRNRLKFMRRNARFWQQMLGLGFFLCFSFPKNMMAFMFKKRWDLADAYQKGTLDFLRAI